LRALSAQADSDEKRKNGDAEKRGRTPGKRGRTPVAPLTPPAGVQAVLEALEELGMVAREDGAYRLQG
jgi:hypothetical protein